jgi:hypothetical protein
VNGHVASSFEVGFREINGRAPTADETRRYLTYDRLAKTSEPPLDPLTMLLMVDAGRVLGTDRVELSAQLDRIEARLQKTAAPAKPTPVVTGPTRDLIVFTAALLTCVAVAVVSAGASAPAPFVAIVAAFVLGVAVALGYIWISPIVTRGRR